MPGYSHLHEDLCGIVEQVYQFLGEMSIVWERQGGTAGGNCWGNGWGTGGCRGNGRGNGRERGESGEVAGLLADPICVG